MNTDKKVAVVTGSNRGIGLEICRQLAHEGLTVIMTSRHVEKGQNECEKLKADGLDVYYLSLDVTDGNSIQEFKVHLMKDFGRCDVLVNNAGVFPDASDASGQFTNFFNTTIETMRKGMDTNVYGPMLLCQALVPLMKSNGYGRIVNLSSGMGQLTHMDGGCPSYRLSKTSLNALTRILSAELKNENILVNSMCPGWVKTDMGGPNAVRSLGEGADTALWLATLSDDGPRGGFFRDRKEFEW